MMINSGAGVWDNNDAIVWQDEMKGAEPNERCPE